MSSSHRIYVQELNVGFKLICTSCKIERSTSRIYHLFLLNEVKFVSLLSELSVTPIYLARS
ncbi:hypothetical protein MEO40_27255, partial [Dolichospermum sp. ST_sed1]|nr:hypothetical protein [Dolichospermum sp. ST_sed1]